MPAKADDMTLYVKDGGSDTHETVPDNNPNLQPTQPKNDSLLRNGIAGAVVLQSAKQIYDSSVSAVGLGSGNTNVTKRVEQFTSGLGQLAGIYYSKGLLLPVIAINTASEAYTAITEERRADFQQVQNQKLTGIIAVDRSR